MSGALKIKNEEVDVEKILDRDRFVKTLKYPLGITHNDTIVHHFQFSELGFINCRYIFIKRSSYDRHNNVSYWSKSSTVTDSIMSDDYNG